jgi:hypothetical protein
LSTGFFEGLDDRWLRLRWLFEGQGASHGANLPDFERLNNNLVDDLGVRQSSLSVRNLAGKGGERARLVLGSTAEAGCDIGRRNWKGSSADHGRCIETTLSG